MLPLKKLKNIDPVRRQAERAEQDATPSPMDPPDPYSIPETDEVAIEDLHPFLRELHDEHDQIVAELERFESMLTRVREGGVDPQSVEDLSGFFRFVDDAVLPHQAFEEKTFFAPLQERLLEAGTHSPAETPVTPVDMLESDHVTLIQTAAVTFNLFGLAARLPDMRSQVLAFDAAIQQGFSMVERLRLHIFREDHVVFPLVQKYFTDEELDGFAGRRQGPDRAESDGSG